jgi:hypothetical protein
VDLTPRGPVSAISKRHSPVEQLTHVFGYYLRKGFLKMPPAEELQVLVNPSRTRLLISHQPVIEIGSGHLGLSDSDGLQFFQVASVTILVLNRELNVQEALQEIEELGRSDVALIRPPIINAGNTNHAILVVQRLKWLETNTKAVLVSLYEEPDHSTATCRFFPGPNEPSVIKSR